MLLVSKKGATKWRDQSEKDTMEPLKPKWLEKPSKDKKTEFQIVSEYSIHPNQIVQWKKQLFEEAPQIFSRKRNQAEKTIEEKEAELYRQIGQLKVELDWVKKNLDCSMTDKRRLVDPTSHTIPFYRPGELLDLSRSGYSYQPVPESEADLLVMNLIDQQYTLDP